MISTSIPLGIESISFLYLFHRISVMLGFQCCGSNSKDWKTFSQEESMGHFPSMFKYLYKGATKLYFVHYLCVVIILFNADSYKSSFSTCSFEKLNFHLSMEHFVCSVLNSMWFSVTFYNICVIIVYNKNCFVILFGII